MKLKTLGLYLLLLLSSINVVDARTHDDQLKFERKSRGITAEDWTIDDYWDDRTAEYGNDFQESSVATKEQLGHWQGVLHIVRQFPFSCMRVEQVQGVKDTGERDTIEAMPEDVDER